MRAAQLTSQYFDWMYRLVCDERFSKRLSYRKLLAYLYDTEFIFVLDMDANRAEDGTDLRFRFGYENSLDQAAIERYLDNKPCSVLEMMIALSIRCEEHIMSDSNAGNRTGQWFWNMVVNLGLGPMSDAKFDRETASQIIDRFLHRQYAPDGKGGLFTITNCRYNLRTVEIWYQAMWYLDEVLQSQEESSTQDYI